MKIATHSDADGVTSAVLLVKGLKLEEGEYTVRFPEKFGDVRDEDYCLDMRPIDPDYEGTVIDHHPCHSEDRKYTLIHGDVPASRLVYDQVKNDLTEKDDWKVVVGVSGDGQPEVTPNEIWERHPELFDEVVSIYLKYGIESMMSVYPNRVFSLLSSYINSACRLFKPEIAFGVLKDATDVYDVINNAHLINFKKKLYMIRKGVLENLEQVIQTRNFCFVMYSADARIEGVIASKIQQEIPKTIIALNQKTMSGSIRGVLSNWLVEKMNMIGIESGGHAGYAGFSITSSAQIELIKKLIRKI